jgi:PIN domain nuclease of toxin-antitoxin system
MRYYVDTNVLLFILSKNKDDISFKVYNLLSDYANMFYVSSVAVKELILLYRIGKIKHRRFKSEKDMLDEIERSEIKIVFFNEHHFSKYAKLTIVEGHKDMNDHAIISQAISDKITLISSDSEFENYTAQGLNFVFNKR